MDSDYLSYDAVVGKRHIIDMHSSLYPAALREIAQPPERLYVVGNPAAMQEGLAVVGARKATPYGKGCARRFAKRAAERGIVIISGGARGCDSEAHKAALEAGVPTVVFVCGGCDVIYPKENRYLFQDIVNAGGALVSEHDWTMPPLAYMFRARNRLIAGLARATLIVEAGLPSGTFSTADEALEANKEVLVVPGSIDSPQSRGANRLIYQGSIPIVDEDAFDDQLLSLFGLLKQEVGEVQANGAAHTFSAFDTYLLEALCASPLGIERIHELAQRKQEGEWKPSKTQAWIALMETRGLIAKYPGGTYGAKTQ